MIDVVVPTYQRPDDLRRCLAGLRCQRHPPGHVFLVVRDSDAPTKELVADYVCSNIKMVTVSSPGQLAAIRSGVERSSADIIAFTDDDAVPRPDWLEQIRAALL